MPSLLLTATYQGVLLAGLSNFLAQAISAARENKKFTLDLPLLSFFLLWTLITCPPNVLWQIYLENNFPSDTVDSHGEKKLDKTNTVIKTLLDQSLSAGANTIGYIAAVAAFKRKGVAGIVDEVQKDFWPLMRDGWKVWPFVAVLSFSVVPLKQRPLFWSVAGLFWNIYLSLWATE